MFYLVHAGLVQSHDGSVSQPVVHGAQSFLGVEVLWFEQLFHKLFIEHGCDDVIHHCKDKESLVFAAETARSSDSFHTKNVDTDGCEERHERLPVQSWHRAPAGPGRRNIASNINTCLLTPADPTLV